MKRFWIIPLALFAAGIGIGLLYSAVRPVPREKAFFLPEAQNDKVFSVIGFGSSEAPVASVTARPEQDSYPVGTESISLVVLNNASDTLLYTSWFDFRKVDGGEVLPLTPRDGAMVNPDSVSASFALAPGETATIPIPIDIFDEPLSPGIYRVSQLACFIDPHGEALACTEITADFTISAN